VGCVWLWINGGLGEGKGDGRLEGCVDVYQLGAGRKNRERVRGVWMCINWGQGEGKDEGRREGGG
jgi:hypothetical protein